MITIEKYFGDPKSESALINRLNKKDFSFDRRN